MYHKVLIPLDGSVASEFAFALIQREIAPDGEIILLNVIPPAKTQRVGSHVVLGSQQEEVDRYEAAGYLNRVAKENRIDSGRWRPEVVVSGSVDEGIVGFAQREAVDLIAMFTHDRGLFGRLVKGSVAREVQRRASTEVRVLRPRELTSYGPVATGGGEQSHLDTRLFDEVDLFQDLSEEQIQKVVSLGERIQVSAGEKQGTGGELGQNLFVIVQGEASLSAHSEIGEIAVRVAGPGESFPLAALLGTGALITSAEALTDMDLLAIPRSELLEFCSTELEIGMRIYSNMAQLFANRYSATLTQLAISAERELRNTIT